MSNRDLCVILALMALWGLNFSAIQLGVDQINPLLLTAARFFCAVIPAIFFVPRPQVAWRFLVAYGLCFGVGIWGVMTLAMDLGLSPGMAGLLLQLNIVSGLLLGRLVFGEALTAPKLVGAGMAMAGLMLSLFLTDGSVTLMGLLLALCAAVCWSLMGVIVKKADTDKVFAFGVWGMAFAPIPLVILAGYWFGTDVFLQLPEQFNARALFSILFQAWPTTLLGYWLWNKLNRKYPMSTVAPFTLLVPLFGFLGSVLFYGEQMGLVKIAACVLILAGLAIGQGWVKLPSGSFLAGVQRL